MSESLYYNEKFFSGLSAAFDQAPKIFDMTKERAREYEAYSIACTGYALILSIKDLYKDYEKYKNPAGDKKQDWDDLLKSLISLAYEGIKLTVTTAAYYGKDKIMDKRTEAILKFSFTIFKIAHEAGLIKCAGESFYNIARNTYNFSSNRIYGVYSYFFQKPLSSASVDPNSHEDSNVSAANPIRGIMLSTS
jgi:hypothetical protein